MKETNYYKAHSCVYQNSSEIVVELLKSEVGGRRH